MEVLGFGDVNELFGYALPGLVLSGLVAVFFRRYTQFSLGELALLVALASLPAGFLWVYVVYHQGFWKIMRANTWRRFTLDIIDGMQLNGDDGVRLRNMMEKDRFNLVDRYLSSIRNRYPLITFYHVRHHTLRNLGLIMAVVPASRLLVDFKMSPLSYVLIGVLIGLGLASILAADICLDIMIRQLSYLAAQDRDEMIKELRNALQDPFRRWIVDC